MCEATKPSSIVGGQWVCVSDHTIEPDTCYFVWRRHPVIDVAHGIVTGFILASAVLFWVGVGYLIIQSGSEWHE